MRRALSSRRRWLFVTLALLLLLVAALSWKGLRVLQSVQQLRLEVDGAAAALGQLQSDPVDAAAFSSVALSMGRVSSSLTALRAEVEPLYPLLRAARPLPAQAGWVADVPDLLEVAVPLAQVGDVVLRPVAEAAESAAVAPPQEQITHYLSASSSLATRLPEITPRLDQAETALRPLHGRQVGGPLAPVAPFLDQGPALIPFARLGLQLLAAAGPALGMDVPRRYLLVGQNSAEIRATGGFIGSVGTIVLDRGRLAGLEYGSSYAADEGVRAPAPPYPLARYLGLGGWYLRDANWWPDFPASAAQVEEAWRRAGRPPIDGVVALDSTAVTRLLKLVGPVEVPGYGQVDAEGFEKAAAEQLYSRSALVSAATFHQAKSAFFGAASRAVVDRLLLLPASRLVPLGQELLRLLQEKHLLLALKEPRLQQLAHVNGWDGAIPPISGDSLLVVDTTVSYGDTYSFIRTQDTLSINIADDGRQQHELVLDYNNIYPRGLPSWMPPAMVGGQTFDSSTGKLVENPGFWGDWLRVYLPPDARVTSVQGLLDVAPPVRETGRLLVAGYLPLEPGRRRTVRLSYVTNSQGERGDGSHRLFFQKQPGLEGRSISVRLTWPGGETATYGGRPAGNLWLQFRGNTVLEGKGTSSNNGG